MYLKFKKFWTFYATAVVPPLLLKAITTPIAAEAGSSVVLSDDVDEGLNTFNTETQIYAGQGISGNGIPENTVINVVSTNTVSNTNIDISSKSTADIPKGSVVTLAYEEDGQVVTKDFVTANDSPSGNNTFMVEGSVSYPEGVTPEFSSSVEGAIPANTTVTQVASIGSATIYTATLSNDFSENVKAGSEITVAAEASYTPPSNVHMSIQNIYMNTDTTGIVTIMISPINGTNSYGPGYAKALLEPLNTIEGYSFELASTQSGANASTYLVYNMTADTPFEIGDPLFANANPNVPFFGNSKDGITVNGSTFDDQTPVI